MSERSTLIARLLSERDYRANYIRAKLDVLVPSQLRALRQRRDLTQPVLAEQSGMKQSRISAMETPGRTNFNLETLVRMAATLNVGLKVQFVPFSEMLGWENDYSQDSFNVVRLSDDVDFLQPRIVRQRTRRVRTSRLVSSRVRIAPTSFATAGLGTGTYMIPVQRERAQMKLQFEASEQSSAQARGAELITLPNRKHSVLDNLGILQMAASAGAGRSAYGN